MYIIGTILAISFLIIIHELGHFLMARWRGVDVEVFSLGMGPSIYQTKDKFKTNYKVAPLLIGGYVQLKEEGENSMAVASSIDKFFIYIGGILMNVLLAILFLSLALGIWGEFGVEYSYQGETFTEYENVSEQKIYISELDREIDLENAQIDSSIVFTKVPLTSVPEKVFSQTKEDTTSMFEVIGSLISNESERENVISIVGIGAIMTKVLEANKAYFIYLLYALSLNLAFFNSLPLPALDGGHILFIFLNKIFYFIDENIRKKFEVAAHTGMFLMLMILAGVLVYKDITKLIN